MPWILRGLSNGVITSKYPKKMDSYGDSHHSSVKVQTEYLASRDTDLEGLCPTGAIRVELGRPRIDLGQCILCGRCVDRAPEIFSFSTDFETARLSRDLLRCRPRRRQHCCCGFHRLLHRCLQLPPPLALSFDDTSPLESRSFPWHPHQ